MDIPTSFIWIITFSDGVYEYGDGEKFEVMLGQTLKHSA
jgi:hypothetical protein